MTTAPGLIHEPWTKCALPIAATRMSASRMRASMSLVRLWHTVTVAFSCSSRRAAGMPTMFDRPSTTADLPLISMPFLWSSSMQPCESTNKGGAGGFDREALNRSRRPGQASERGSLPSVAHTPRLPALTRGVQATNRGLRPRSARSPTFAGCKPSTSFSGEISESTRISLTCSGKGSCEMARARNHVRVGGAGSAGDGPARRQPLAKDSQRLESSELRPLARQRCRCNRQRTRKHRGCSKPPTPRAAVARPGGDRSPEPGCRERARLRWQLGQPPQFRPPTLPRGGSRRSLRFPPAPSTGGEHNSAQRATKRRREQGSQSLLGLVVTGAGDDRRGRATTCAAAEQLSPLRRPCASYGRTWHCRGGRPPG